MFSLGNYLKNIGWVDFGEFDLRELFWVTRGTPVPNLAKK